MHAAAHELEVVGGHEKDSESDEGQQSDAHFCHSDETQHDRPCKARHRGHAQHCARYLGPQGPSMELVQCVR